MTLYQYLKTQMVYGFMQFSELSDASSELNVQTKINRLNAALNIVKYRIWFEVVPITFP